MRARVFVQRRRVIGLRPFAFALVALLGTMGVIVVPAALTTGVVLLLHALGVPPWFGVLSALVTALATAFGAFHVVGRGLEESLKLRAPWGGIAIGAEGVRWDDWVRRKLTPWREVHGTITEGDALVLITREGGRIVLQTSDPAALGDSVLAARTAHAASTRADIPSALTDEGNVSTWITRTRTLLARGSYRDGGVPPDALTRVLEDPDAPAAARIGAAAALLPSDAALRVRVEQVRDESVDDELARALDDLLEERIVPARWAKLARRR